MSSLNLLWPRLSTLVGASRPSHAARVVVDERGCAEDWTGAVVAAVSARGDSAVGAAVERAAARKAAALIVRLPVWISEDTRAAAREAGLAVFGLPEGDSWATLLTALDAVVRLDPDGFSLTVASVDQQLSALVDAIAELVDAPITVEDHRSRVLAYSAGQQGADPARLESIVERRTPAHLEGALRAAGVFRDVHRTDRPVFVPSPVPGVLPRMGVSVRSGLDVLGTLWAIVHEPMTLTQQRAFRHGARRIAVHLLRERAAAEGSAAADSRRWLEVLEGRPGARTAAAEARLDRPLLVWACEPRRPSRSVHASAERRQAMNRLIDALRFDPACSHPDSGVVAAGDTVYVLQPVASTRRAEQEAGTRARSFLSRRGGQLCDRIAISRIAQGADDVPRARRDADRALRALQTEYPVGAVGTIEDLASAALLVELRDLAMENGHQPSSAVQRLLDYDRSKGTELVPTLRSWLTHLGDIAPAAADMNVHPNTFRYRLRRAFEIGDLDAEAAAPRTLSLMLDLKLVELQQT